MFETSQWLALSGILVPVVLGLVTLGIGYVKSRRDNQILKEGLSALYKVVESNQQVVESLVAERRATAATEESRLTLERSRHELNRWKMIGGIFRFLMENSD